MTSVRPKDEKRESKEFPTEGASTPGGKNKAKKEPPKFTHNPVTAKCYTFEINTFNIENQDIAYASELNLSQDIIFLQESKKQDKKQREYTYRCKAEGPKHNGILVKDSVFEIVEEDKYSYDNRRCTLILKHRDEPEKKLVAISWHGSNPGETDDKKQPEFEELMNFAKKMKTEHSASVIIGGDFNVDKDTVVTWLTKFPEFKAAAPETKGKRKNSGGRGRPKGNIDFFVSDLIIEETDSIDMEEKVDEISQTFSKLNISKKKGKENPYPPPPSTR